MKTKLFTVRLLLFVGLTITSLQVVNAAQGKDYKVVLNETRSNEIGLGFAVDNMTISEVTKNGVKYSQLNFSGSSSTNQKGYAELPIISSNVQLSPSKNVTLVADGGDYTDYQLQYPLLPSRGTIYRNQNPELIPYEINPASVVDEWYPSSLAVSTEPYIIRDVRGAGVFVNPVQYNAAKKTVRIYNSINVKLVENETAAINPLVNYSKEVDPEMFTAYQSLFINYNTRANWKNETGDFGEILVVYTSRDASAIKPYIDWKKQMGYKVNEKTVANGTNVKATIKTEYDNNKKIAFVLLVGDWAEIKSDLGGGASAPMDPMLGCVVGTDNFADIVVGRFSASSATDVTVQANKTISYEKTPSGTWYKTALHIASTEGSGIGDDGEIDYNHSDNIWKGRLNKGTYTTQKKAYDPGATASMVSTAVNAGVSVINYTGHGLANSFYTTGFSSSNVNSLTNEGKYPFIFSVACINGEFHKSTCFAEAWLRKANGGAVATIMSTINQPWAPPMRGQDYMNDLLTGGYTYSNNATNPGKGTNIDHGKTRFGSITFNATVLMYAESAGDEDLQTIQTWTIFGDPSVQVRTDEPKVLVAAKSDVSVGSFTTNVSVAGKPFENALVSIWDGTNQPFSALTDASGNVTINHTLAQGANETLTITGFNLMPLIKTGTVGGPTSVNNISVSNAVNVWPNPSNGDFTFTYSLPNNENAKIKVLDVMGKVVYTDVLSQNAQSKKIALGNVGNGIYFLQFENSNGTVTKKLNIQK